MAYLLGEATEAQPTMYENMKSRLLQPVTNWLDVKNTAIADFAIDRLVSEIKSLNTTDLMKAIQNPEKVITDKAKVVAKDTIDKTMVEYKPAFMWYTTAAFALGLGAGIIIMKLIK